MVRNFEKLDDGNYGSGGVGGVGIFFCIFWEEWLECFEEVWFGSYVIDCDVCWGLVIWCFF